MIYSKTELMLTFPKQSCLFSDLVAECLLWENACFSGIINHTLLGGN